MQNDDINDVLKKFEIMKQWNTILAADIGGFLECTLLSRPSLQWLPYSNDRFTTAVCGTGIRPEANKVRKIILLSFFNYMT